MKKWVIVVVFSAFASISIMLFAKEGCLHNSYDLKQKYDPKEYHAVECYCPCDYWAMKGLKSLQKSICLECGHAHDPGPNPYVPQTREDKVPVASNPPINLQALILYSKAKR